MRRGRPRHDDVLTPREWEVLDLLRGGLTNEQIAAQLGISPDTAKFHVSEILGKLGVQSRQEAAAWQGRPRRSPILGLPGGLGRLSPLQLAGAAVLAVAVLGLGALAVGLVVMDSGSRSNDVSSEIDTGDEALDAIIEGLLQDDASALETRFAGVTASEGVFNVGGVGPPNLPSAVWTARLATANRSLYAVFEADPRQDESRPWSPDLPFIRSTCELERDPSTSLPRSTGCVPKPDIEPGVYVILSVEIDTELYGWRFGVRDGRVTDVAIPTLGAPDELKTPGSFVPRQPGEEDRYLVLPPPGPMQQDIETFALEPVTGKIEFAEVSGDAFPAGPGVYFLDVQTGKVEGWYRPGDEPYPWVEFALSGDNRFVVARLRYGTAIGRPLLADRSTRKVYQWQGDAELLLSGGEFGGGRQIAALGSRVIFRFPTPYPNPSAEDWFAVVDLDPQPRTVATFRAIGTRSEWRSVHGLLSLDGRHAVVFGEKPSIVSLATGDVTEIAARLYDRIDPEGVVTLQNTLGGEGFLFTVSPVKEEHQGLWLHYRWDGSLLAEGTSANQIYPSPNGGVLATVEPVVQATMDEGSPWYVFHAVDTSDGRPLFRVIGVSTSTGLAGGNRWLADNSGLVVDGRSIGLAMAMRDGTFRPYVGMPSPESTSLFAAGSVVKNDAGEIIASVMPPERVQDFASPWGSTGAEIRFFTPHLGHDGGGRGPGLVETSIEQPPYQDPPRLQLNEKAAGVVLRDAPAGNAVVGRLGPPRVQVLETEFLVLEVGMAGYDTHCDLLRLINPQATCSSALYGQWARVATDDGREGWLLVEVGIPGI